jgi:hypothetical protein
VKQIVINPKTFPSEVEIARMSGLVDADGCIWFGIRQDKIFGYKRVYKNVRQLVKLQMVCKPTVETFSEFVWKITGNYIEVKRERRTEDRRWQWYCTVNAKLECQVVLRTLLPHLYTKKVEALLALDYLNRACIKSKYTAVERDYTLAELSSRIKNGDEEARTKAITLLGSGNFVPSSIEHLDYGVGLETRSVRLNNNPIQEPPASSLFFEKDDEIVRSLGENLGTDINNQ